ncbi:unnamed protein product [Adineta ricciae]|uniref:Uncharacterized protein n=1 Tax=Adineta ricciae TaxID=249248 RepID=A0A814VP81_ADIRI|nr:unnamed protein product [Adineta ricciae]CAF1193707.1 unnamed protein product [Adineta ricciae]
MNRTHHIELRLLLTCLYIYLNYQTIVYIKQVIFHFSFFESPFDQPFMYIHIRATVGSCVSLIYRCLLLYALWKKMADLLLVSIIFLGALAGLRVIFDVYGYFSGYIKQSLYYPFPSFETKQMTEEVVDLVFVLLRNCVGLVLSMYMFTDLISNHTLSNHGTKETDRRSSISE